MLLLTCLFCLDWPRIESAEFPPAAQEAALAATVRVATSRDDRAGAGVVVGRRDGKAFVLTADHLVADVTLTLHAFTAASNQVPAREFKSVEVIKRWPDIDLALLSVAAADAPPTVARLAGRTTSEAERFPALSVGCDLGGPPSCKAVTVTGKKLVVRADSKNRFFWQTADTHAVGRSGGPLFDKTGRVIGICSANQGERGYFVHQDEIFASLKRSGSGWLFDEK